MKQIKQFDLVSSIKDYFNISPYMGIIEWATRYINFSDDVSAQRDTIDWDAYPYQKDILEAFADLVHIKEVVVCAPQQCGKTLIEIVAMLWWMKYCPRSAAYSLAF